MPVEDHPVHPSTVRTNPHPSCWNKPRRREPYHVKDGFILAYIGNHRFEAVQILKLIPDPLSLECRYDQPLGMWECEGCEHINPDYVRKIREQQS